MFEVESGRGPALLKASVLKQKPKRFHLQASVQSVTHCSDETFLCHPLQSQPVNVNHRAPAMKMAGDLPTCTALQPANGSNSEGPSAVHASARESGTPSKRRHVLAVPASVISWYLLTRNPLVTVSAIFSSHTNLRQPVPPVCSA